MKTRNADGASVRDQKAAALDRLVKAELEKSRATQAAKMSNLRALRLARDSAPGAVPVSIPKAPRAVARRRIAS